MSDFGFSKKLRLLGAADFQPVFKNALVIAKKNIAKAVQRNRVKRILRESFRHNQSLLPTLDIVILARSGLGALTSEQIRKKIERHWVDLIHKAGKTSETRNNENAG